MTEQQIVFLAIFCAMVAMFIWGKLRHDVVALGALLACVAAGIVPGASAFAGFAHPAVLTVAFILILSGGLRSSGAVDLLTQAVRTRSSNKTLNIAILTTLAAVLSGFMNNVGALAMLMPVGVQMAKRLGLPAGKVLMPLAFGSILGGMTTLIGTPPNLIVSAFRASTGQPGFLMFDFAPVGLAVAGIGVTFVVIFSRWLVPDRRPGESDEFDITEYVTEIVVPAGSRAIGKRLAEIEAAMDAVEARVVGIIHDGQKLAAPGPARHVSENDVLLIIADPDGLAAALSTLGLRFAADKQQSKDKSDDKTGNGKDDKQFAGDKKAKSATRGSASSPTLKGTAQEKRATTGKLTETVAESSLATGEIELREVLVQLDSRAIGMSASDMELRTRYGINLLAISRQGRKSAKRLGDKPVKAGDVLLIQGKPGALSAFCSRYGCVPLAERDLRLPDGRKALLAAFIMLGSVLAAGSGLVHTPVAFAAGVLAVVLTGVVPTRTLYDSIDWPIITLLAALIPISGAFAATGSADLFAKAILGLAPGQHAIIALTLVLVLTMTLSDFMNNAATAAMMCPLAAGVAQQLGVSADPFLMAVAIGASCAFLTPIGHQNNLLILGRSGFSFGDYWRLGLPLELLVIATAVPLLVLVWSL